MSYTPHEWQNDELITAAKLNNIEEGIAAGGSGGGLFPIGQIGSSLDKTWREILYAIQDGKIPYLYNANLEYNFASVMYVREMEQDDNIFYVYFVGWDNSQGYSSSSPDGYPTYFD